MGDAAPDQALPDHEPQVGRGKVGRFWLDEKATALGAEVALLDGPGFVDVADLARKAVADGADLLGVAGGDGTQALVAGVAAEHGLPFLVISAGTRNHFAMDLGLDREHPDHDLDALTDSVEVGLDLGVIGGRTFVNNASFGAYAAVVQSPAYREDKAGTTLQMLPDLLSGQRGPELVVRIDGEVTVKGPKALLVSNNPYELGDLAGMGRRARLDRGSWVSSPSRWTVPLRQPGCSAAGRPGVAQHGRPRGGGRLGRRRDLGWHRWGGSPDANPRPLHHPAARTAGAGLAKQAGGAGAETAAGQSLPARTAVHPGGARQLPRRPDQSVTVLEVVQGPGGELGQDGAEN